MKTVYLDEDYSKLCDNQSTQGKMKHVFIFETYFN